MIAIGLLFVRCCPTTSGRDGNYPAVVSGSRHDRMSPAVWGECPRLAPCAGRLGGSRVAQAQTDSPCLRWSDTCWRAATCWFGVLTL